MQSKRFEFEDSDTGERLRVEIPEVLDASYGMYTWPSAVVLAQFIWNHRTCLGGKTMLEIGAGTALPGIVAGTCGAAIHLSDSSHLPRCVDNSVQSCRANDLHGIPVHSIAWGRFDPDLLELPPLDIILASDCFYDTKDFEDILVTISFLLERNPKTEFWCAYQERSVSRSIEHLLHKWSLVAQYVPLSSFGAEGTNIAGSDLPGAQTIHMFIIRRKET